MTRRVRIVAIVLGVLVVIGLVLPRLVNVENFRPKLEAELTAALGRKVTVGNLSLSVFGGTVSADNISIADDPAFSKEPFVIAKSFQAGAEVMPLIFSKTLHITGITFAEPQITLLRSPNGTWNFSSLGAKSATDPAAKPGEGSGGVLSVDKLNVNGGRVLVGIANSAHKPEVYEKVNIEVSDFSATTQFPFKVDAALPGGGDLDVKGKCGPLGGGAAGSAPFEATIKARSLDLAASGFVSASSGIQGIADFDGVINSNGQQAKVSGTFKADKLKLAAKGAPSKRTVALKYAIDHNLKTDAGTLTQGDVAIGKAVARLTGSYQTQGETTSLNMKLNAGDMPLDEIEAVLPAFGVVLPSGSKLQGGTLSADLNITGTSGQPTITGPIRLANAKLAGFDMGSKLSAIPGLGAPAGGKDTVLQNCSTTVRVAPESTQASAINATIPSLGVVTGDGTISSSGALNFDMKADLANRQGNGVAFTIEGTTADPKFVPNVKSIAGGAAKQAITGKVSEQRVGRRRN